MRASAFWKAVTVDRSNMLERFFDLLRTHNIRFCLIGGQALNAYVEPVVSLDLDVVIASDKIGQVETLAAREFVAERFPHSLNLSAVDSNVRIQIQLDPRYAPFVDRASTRTVLDLDLPVATIEDILQGKIWAVQDPARRGSKRQKDLADISRVLERFPDLKPRVPADVLGRLI
jgi:nucleotidyltransferase AbiEii toxin of type IV toxin-antitoxin system